jgi:hypothetical protein
MRPTSPGAVDFDSIIKKRVSCSAWLVEMATTVKQH